MGKLIHCNQCVLDHGSCNNECQKTDNIDKLLLYDKDENRTGRPCTAIRCIHNSSGVSCGIDKCTFGRYIGGI